MLSVTLGPLSLPTGPLLLVLTTLGASFAARTWARRRGIESPARVADTVFTLVWIALAGARLGHLILHADAYVEHPLLMLDIRDGGWNAWAGLLAGALALTWTVKRHPDWQGVLVPVSLAAVTVMLGASLALDRLTPERLPPLPLQALDQVHTPDLATEVNGHPTVVVLWASWCGVCRRELPMLLEVRQHHPKVRFLFVNQGEDTPTVRRATREWGLTESDVRLDPMSRLGQALGSTGLPTTVFLDARGQRVHVHPGLLTSAGLKVRIGEICPDC